MIIYSFLMSINYYSILGVPHDCPQETIPQAFRNRAKQIHPDKCKISDDANQNKEATIILLEAYRVLNNPALRKEYDLHQQQEMKQTELHWNRYL